MLHLRSLLFALTFYLTTATLLVGGVWLLLAPRRWALAVFQLHGRISLWLLDKICRTRFEVRGREHLPQRPFLVAAKHQSTWDTFGLVHLFDDPAFVLKEELKFIPFYGWFCVKLRHILVRRERAAAALRRLVTDARERASSGREILIFPEGTRQAPGAEPDYKPGYVALYEGLQLPCVPVALNSGVYWPRRSFLRYPGTIVVEFLEPVPAGLPRQQFRSLVEQRIETATARLLAEKPDPTIDGLDGRQQTTDGGVTTRSN